MALLSPKCFTFEPNIFFSLKIMKIKTLTTSIETTISCNAHIPECFGSIFHDLVHSINTKRKQTLRVLLNRLLWKQSPKMNPIDTMLNISTKSISKCTADNSEMKKKF